MSFFRDSHTSRDSGFSESDSLPKPSEKPPKPNDKPKVKAKVANLSKLFENIAQEPVVVKDSKRRWRSPSDLDDEISSVSSDIGRRSLESSSLQMESIELPYDSLCQ